MASEIEIFQTLLSAATGQAGAPGWPELLRLLAETTRADSLALRFDQRGRRVAAWHHGPPPPELAQPEKLRAGRVYAQGDLPGLGPRPAPLRALRAPAGPGGCALLLMRRAPGAEDFRAIDGVQLSTLAPYLGPALTGWQGAEAVRARAARDRALARDLGAGWILFSPTGQILDRGAGLEGLLAGSGARLTGDGRLHLPEEGSAQALRAALARPDPAWLLLSAAPRLEVWITPEGPGARLARLRRPPGAAALPPARVAAQFALAPAEARLAQRICDGRSLAEAAGDLGWTLESTRSASKQVFARMGVRGQAGVIRQMQGGALWLAPPEGDPEMQEAGPDSEV
ncbi:helix-turn-helix transcriptional regulator [Pseudooceanicola sp. 200-1SW]|uniref:helix-turn-helix transcriptional regulator n=1 Tax=Pseudooceanicola sp. 200-1SW TaxID=3425949 RepID=UPI003D7F71DD